jgi:hypothetical protein
MYPSSKKSTAITEIKITAEEIAISRFITKSYLNILYSYTLRITGEHIDRILTTEDNGNMAKRELRFGIHDSEENGASTWKLWTETAGGKSDIYLACRSLGGKLKTSLHESGKWHIAFSKSEFENNVKDFIPSLNDRFIVKWPRPKEIQGGITLAYRIVTPYSAVTSKISTTDLQKVTWIPNAPNQKATEIDIFILNSTIRVTGWPGKNAIGTSLIGKLALESGETVWVVYRIVDIPDLTSSTRGSGNFFRGINRDDLKSNNLRTLVFGSEPDGSKVIYDCAIEVNKKT